MVNDAISNLVISLKNASSVKKDAVRVPYSRLSLSILELLEKEGFVASVEKSGKDLRKHIDVELAYENGSPKISDVKRVSKFSKRVYTNAKDIRPVKHGFGMLVLTTPQGIMSGAQAQKAHIGGEVLFEIW